MALIECSLPGCKRSATMACRAHRHPQTCAPLPYCCQICLDQHCIVLCAQQVQGVEERLGSAAEKKSSQVKRLEAVARGMLHIVTYGACKERFGTFADRVDVRPLQALRDEVWESKPPGDAKHRQAVEELSKLALKTIHSHAVTTVPVKPELVCQADKKKVLTDMNDGNTAIRQFLKDCLETWQWIFDFTGSTSSPRMKEFLADNISTLYDTLIKHGASVGLDDEMADLMLRSLFGPPPWLRKK